MIMFEIINRKIKNLVERLGLVCVDLMGRFIKVFFKVSIYVGYKRRDGVIWSDYDEAFCIKSRLITGLLKINTPLLIRFCRSGNLAMVRLLLRLKFNPNKSYMGETPLTAAIKSNIDTDKKINIIRRLLDNGAKVDGNECDYKEFYMGTPLWEACFFAAEFEVVKILVQYGADVNYSRNGKSVLMLACRNLHTKVIKFLVENGADAEYGEVNLGDLIALDGIILGTRTALDEVVSTYNDIIEKQELKIDLVEDMEGSQFIKQFFRGLGFGALEVEFERGVDYRAARYVFGENWRNKLTCTYDNTTECQKARLDIARFLIASRVNIYDNCGSLMRACGVDHPNLHMIKFLVERGSDISYVNDLGENYLIKACSAKNPNLDVVKFLIDQGVNINQVDDRDKSSLARACERNNFCVAKYLINKGARFDYHDIPELFSNMTQLEPQIICAIYNTDISQLSKLTSAYWRGINSKAAKNPMNTETETMDFSSILKRHILPRIREIKNDLNEDLLRQASLEQYDENYIENYSEAKLNLRNVCIVERRVCEIINTVNKELNNNIIRLIQMSKRPIKDQIEKNKTSV